MSILSRLNPFRKSAPTVAILRLSGVIGDGGAFRRGLSLHSIESDLEKAFTMRRVCAVALLVNSPGGAPVQADLIHSRIRDLADRHELPVFTFCEDVAASGGYWIALAGEEIFANSSSIIGSIGVVSAGFGFAGAIERIGIERRIYASGPNKSMLDPFQPENPDHVAHLKQLQGEIFELFRTHVRDRRGDRLGPPLEASPESPLEDGSPESAPLESAHGTGTESAGCDEAEIFSGAFWTGERALTLGLIDGIGELHSVMRERFGDRVKFRTIERRQGLIAKLRPNSAAASLETVLGAGAESWADHLLTTLEARALWSRYGL